MLPRVACRAAGDETIVSLERLIPELARGVGMDALVAGEEEELRGAVQVGPAVELVLRLHLEDQLLRFRMRDAGESSPQLGEEPVVTSAGSLREVDLAAVTDGVRPRGVEVDLGTGRLVSIAAVRGGSRRARPVAEKAGVLEPPVRPKEPVGRLHAMVG